MTTNRHALFPIAGFTSLLATLLITLNTTAQTIDFQTDTLPKTNAQNLPEAVSYADKMPSFEGGDCNKFCNWLQKHIMYTQDAIENGVNGTVIISFIIETDGTVSNVELMRPLFPSLDSELIRLIKSSPQWTPGENNSEKVRIKFTMPIRFALQ